MNVFAIDMATLVVGFWIMIAGIALPAPVVMLFGATFFVAGVAWFFMDVWEDIWNG